MSKVTINLECGCFRKSGIDNNKLFESKKLALEEATNMAHSMNKTFCRRHNFTVKEDGENVLIEVRNNN